MVKSYLLRRGQNVKKKKRKNILPLRLDTIASFERVRACSHSTYVFGTIERAD